MLHVFALEKLDNVALHKRRMTNLRTIFFTHRVLNWAIVAGSFVLRCSIPISSLVFVREQFLPKKERKKTKNSTLFASPCSWTQRMNVRQDVEAVEEKLMAATSRCFLIQGNLITWSARCLGKVKEFLDVWSWFIHFLARIFLLSFQRSLKLINESNYLHPLRHFKMHEFEFSKSMFFRLKI